jgi:hypothetical protein
VRNAARRLATYGLARRFEKIMLSPVIIAAAVPEQFLE